MILLELKKPKHDSLEIVMLSQATEPCDVKMKEFIKNNLINHH